MDGRIERYENKRTKLNLEDLARRRGCNICNSVIFE